MDEVGAAAVERAGVGVRMEEEEEEGCTERGVRVAVCVRVEIYIISKLCSYHHHQFQCKGFLPIGSKLNRLGMRGRGSPPAVLGAGGPIMMSSRSSREETLLL